MALLHMLFGSTSLTKLFSGEKETRVIGLLRHKTHAAHNMAIKIISGTFSLPSPPHEYSDSLIAIDTGPLFSYT